MLKGLSLVSMALLILTLTFFSAATIGCGKKGPPKPPASKTAGR